MSKRIIYSVILVSLFCLASFVLADITIPNPLGNTSTFPALLGNIAKAVGDVIAALGVIMIIVAGIFYLTSAGSPERIKTAKTALIYAIVGIAIGIAASTIADIIVKVLKGQSP